MKKLIIYIFFALLVGKAISQGTLSFIDKYTRSNQSCHPSTTYGWYWDGEKCERCAQDECRCTSISSCLRCQPGYSLIEATATSTGANICVKCPSVIEMALDEKNYLRKWVNNDESSAKNIDPITYPQESFVLNEARFSYNEVKECCSPDFGVKWKDEFRYGLRASECKPNEPSARKYLLLGSICFSILGCDEYTPMYDTPYRCAKCMDGYYLNERQECTPCDNQRYPGNTKNQCAKCLGPDQCSECAPGYFLGKNNFRNSITIEDSYQPLYVREYASYCISCPRKNCICELKEPTSGSNINNFNYRGPVSNYYYMDDTNGECPRCDSASGNEGCLKCNYDLSEKVRLKCIECKQYTLDASKLPIKFYAPVTVDFKCYPCPENCAGCTYDTKYSGASCLSDKCFNGYRWILDNNLGKCTACTKQTQRCTTSSSNTEQITQCHTDSVIGATYLNNVYGGYQNKEPPNDNDYYLISTDSQTKKCIKNKYFCKDMYQSSEEGYCRSCYTAKGFVLVKIGSASQCFSCNVPNCKKCQAWAAAVSITGIVLECQTCNSQVDKTTYQATQKNYTIKKLENGNQQCAECPIGCKECTYVVSTTSFECSIDQCQRGFAYETAAKKCAVCQLTNCSSCEKDKFQICLSCFDGYRLWTSKTSQADRNLQICEACDFGCIKCQEQRKKCKRCLPDYYIYADTCHYKKKNCVVHAQIKEDDIIQNGSACKICAYGFRVVDGRCMACFSPRGAQIHCHDGCQLTFKTNVDLDKDRKKPNVKQILLRDLQEN